MTRSAAPGEGRVVTLPAAGRLGGLLKASRKAFAGGTPERIEGRLEAFIDKTPDCAEALYALALACTCRYDLAKAHSLVDQAMALSPSCRQYADLRAVILCLAGQLTDAVYYAKLSITLDPQPVLEGLWPSGLPTFADCLRIIEDQPLLTWAMAETRRGRWRRAEFWYRQHLAFVPGSAPAWIGLATVLTASGHMRAAVDALRAGRHAVPSDVTVVSMLAQSLTAVGDHAAARSCHAVAIERAPEEAGVAAAGLTDRWRDPAVPEAELVADILAWGQQFGVTQNSAPPLATTAEDGPLTVGILVGQNAHAAWMPFLVDCLAAMDRAHWRLVGFGHGDLAGPQSSALQGAFDHWRDVAGLDPLTRAAIVAAEGVQILLDLAGFDAPGDLVAYGARMAPCQIAWTGSPFGTGLAGTDFVLTDRYVCDHGGAVADPPLCLDLGAILVTPPHPMSGNTVSEPSPSLEPRDGDCAIVFAADADIGALDAETVALWATVLERCPGATLVLADRELTHPANLERLTDLFSNHGRADRIDILGGEDAQDRVRLFQHADVVLVPRHAADPQLAMDAIGAGLPIVCPAGTSAFSRAAGSVLHHLGCGQETIAANERAYVEMAVAWASDAARRAEWRRTVAGRLVEAPQLDAKARAIDLETALFVAWSRVVAPRPRTDRDCAA